uniref:Uncharacterized protein n=1 Tax=Oryza sativa subsp. japonica TaxID=39947 RepID=Q69RP5_ORYSJ|nr:hypothetical protein [Oryza sativa Japonica Group]
MSQHHIWTQILEKTLVQEHKNSINTNTRRKRDTGRGGCCRRRATTTSPPFPLDPAEGRVPPPPSPPFPLDPTEGRASPLPTASLPAGREGVAACRLPWLHGEKEEARGREALRSRVERGERRRGVAGGEENEREDKGDREREEGRCGSVYTGSFFLICAILAVWFGLVGRFF